MLSMDGPLFECDVYSLQCTQLFDLVKELNIPANQQPHFKAAHSVSGQLFVASNTFDEVCAGDFLALREAPTVQLVALRKRNLLLAPFFFLTERLSRQCPRRPLGLMARPWHPMDHH